MSGGRDRDIELEDLQEDNEGQEYTDPTGEFSELEEQQFAEMMANEDLRVGVAGCWVHPEIPCMESCIAFNLYKDEDEPNCKVMMALDKVAEGQNNRDLMVEHNQILGKIEKTLAGLLHHLQRTT
jgi:hypothetical protein